MSRLQALQPLGQSVWLDFIDRELLTSGALERLIEADHVTGVTSNPAIFEKAIAASSQYDAVLRHALAKGDADAQSLFERVALSDIQRAADILRPVFERTKGADGYVSFEVAPHLSHDANATVYEARRLWAAIDRANLMIKVPGTPAGIAALRQLIADGIPVNVTLLFSRSTYRACAEAYIEGVAALAQRGHAARIASVASFFVSRIDSEIDARVEARLATDTRLSAADRAALEALRGRVAIANAQLAYCDFQAVFTDNPRWKQLARDHGVRPQRLLWASTGTKNPRYRDVVYVESLIGAHTVNTMPPATLDAFRDHGVAEATIAHDVEAAARTLAEAECLGLDLPGVTDKLLHDGLQLFQEADDRLMATLARRRTELLDTRLAKVEERLPEALGKKVAKTLEAWRTQAAVRRLWGRDATLWTGADEAQWLAWLGAAEASRAQLDGLLTFGAEVKRDGFEAIVLLGMGGSSLGPKSWRACSATRARCRCASWTRPTRRRSGPANRRST